MTGPEFIDGGARPEIRVVRTYDHPIERVWRAVTTPEHLARWFPTEVAIDLAPGGKIRFGDLGDGGSEGEVLGVEPPHRLEFLWGDQRLEFRLEPDGAATRFTLVHRFDDRPGAASFATGWEMCLRGLASALDGEAPPAPDRGVARHEELVGRFGLDRPRVTRDAAGWHVRFERQLTCPAATAWRIFSGGDGPGPGEDAALVLDAGEGEPGTRVRLHLGAGTGHGARLVLEVEGDDEAELGPATERWGGTVARVARQASAAG